MEEVISFIVNNLESIMKKKSGRLDYTTNCTIVKIYKCGNDVTRIDIVKKESI